MAILKEQSTCFIFKSTGCHKTVHFQLKKELYRHTALYVSKAQTHQPLYIGDIPVTISAALDENGK